MKRLLCSFGCLLAVGAYAQTIATVESTLPITATTTVTGQSVSSAVITEILSQPGTFGGKTYTGWSFLVNDGTGSMDVYSSAAAMTTLGYTPTVGDAISVSGTYAPYHQIPELETLTAISKLSSGNTVPAPSLWTIPDVNITTLTLDKAGYYIELDGVTINSLGTLTFPAGNSPSAAPYWTVSDGAANSMNLYYWYTSYSADGALSGSTIPTGTVNMEGFVTVYPGSPAEFVPVAYQAVPEPTSFALLGLGLLGFVAACRRQS